MSRHAASSLEVARNLHTKAKRCPKTCQRHKHVFLGIIDTQLPEILAKKEIVEGEQFLEYGCKTGYTSLKYFVPYAKSHNWSITSVDQSAPIIDYAKKHNSNPHVKYVHGDVLESDFELADNKYDRIYSILYLQFVTSDFLDEIKGLYKLLAPGGQLFICIGYKPWLHGMYKKLSDHKVWGDEAKECAQVLDSMFDCVQNINVWKKKLEDLGMKVEQMTTYKKYHCFESTDELIDFALGFTPFADGLSEEKEKELKGLIQAYMLEEKKDKGAVTHDVIYDRIDIIITK